MGTTTRTVTIPEQVSPVVLLGPFDEILRLVEDGFPALTFVVRGRKIEILSHSASDEHQAMQARGFLRHMVQAAVDGQALDADETKRLLDSRPQGDDRGNHDDRDDGDQPENGASGSGADAGTVADRGFEVPYRASKREYFSTSVCAARRKEEKRRLMAEGRAHEEQEAARARRRSQRPEGRTAHAGETADDSRHQRAAAWDRAGSEITGSQAARTARQGVRSRPVRQVDRPVYVDSPRPIVVSQGQPVRAKTAGQRKYVEAIDRHTITFGIGPAGTGKTYLAVAKAVEAFETRQVRRIILTRPAVEAGENLGFLPGTLTDKIDPYLRPLYDALSDMLGPQRLHEETEDGSIEVAPLAYMRGRTLNDAFVILDEAQNTTEQQMKMFLTRLGFNTKMVVTGDSTQIDLAVHRSGLRTIEQILAGIDDIAFVHLGAADVVRHELVGRIVTAYNRHDAKLQAARERVREGQGR